MIKHEKRLHELEQRSHTGEYPAGWPVLVPDEYTDEQIQELKANIGRSDVYRENDKTWTEMFIG